MKKGASVLYVVIFMILLGAPAAAQVAVPSPTPDVDEQAHRSMLRRHSRQCSDATLSDAEFRARWDDCDASRRALDALYSELEAQKKPGATKNKAKRDSARQKAEAALTQAEKPHVPKPTPTPGNN